MNPLRQDHEPVLDEDPSRDDRLAPPLTELDQRRLLDAAIAAIRAALVHRHRLPAASAASGPHDESFAGGPLDEPGASFVTLRDGERLLGCIGSLEPRQSLLDDVTDNALGAAFRDPRLPALTLDEFARMRVHISVLTPATSFPASSFADLRARVRPGTDGLVVSSGRNRATFLPSVWEQLATPDAFLAQLWRKAGLPAEAWPAGIAIERYATFEFGDDGPRAPVA